MAAPLVPGPIAGMQPIHPTVVPAMPGLLPQQVPTSTSLTSTSGSHSAAGRPTALPPVQQLQSGLPAPTPVGSVRSNLGRTAEATGRIEGAIPPGRLTAEYFIGTSANPHDSSPFRYEGGTHMTAPQLGQDQQVS